MHSPSFVLRGAFAGAAFLVILVAATPSAFAQQAGGRQQARQQLESRFAAADANHDGKLDKAEAQAGMPRLAEHFDEIDTDHAGAVTLRQVERWLIAQKRQGKAGG